MVILILAGKAVLAVQPPSQLVPALVPCLAMMMKPRIMIETVLSNNAWDDLWVKSTQLKQYFPEMGWANASRALWERECFTALAWKSSLPKTICLLFSALKSCLTVQVQGFRLKRFKSGAWFKIRTQKCWPILSKKSYGQRRSIFRDESVSLGTKSWSRTDPGIGIILR